MFNDSHLREAIVGFVDLILERRLLVLLINIGGIGIDGHHFLNFLFIILITPRETKLLELLCLALLYYI